MATHSSILAWEILLTEEFCGLQSMASQDSDMTVMHPPPPGNYSPGNCYGLKNVPPKGVFES